MISVVIPSFNRAQFLAEAIRSVIDQKEVPGGMEIIVVDDGSTDDTAEVLENLGEGICVVFQEHSGVSAARNAGIYRSRGEWIAFLDSDDLWLPGKLSAQMKFFSDHPEILVCQTEEIWIRNGRRLNPRKYHKKPSGHCFAALLERCLVSPSAVVIHRSIFDDIGGFDESLPACEDYDLWLRIGWRHPLGLVEKPLVVKRGGHPDQLSSTVQNLDRYRIEALVKLIGTAPLSSEQRFAAERVLGEKRRIYTNGCRKRGNFIEAQTVDELVDKHFSIS